MNANDIDLDISKMIEDLSEDDNVMYFRARSDESRDFCQVQGDLDELAYSLGQAMKHNGYLAAFIQGANAYYLD